MKKLANKKYEIKISENQGATTEDLIRMILNFPVDGGLQFKQFKERERILTQLDKVKDGVFEFEDEDVKNLKIIVTSFKWNKYSNDALNFMEEIEKL